MPSPEHTFTPVEIRDGSRNEMHTQGKSTHIYGKTYKKDFWAVENRNYLQPHYRLEKSARLLNKIADRRPRRLLDVGCGPATLATLLDPNIEYFGIDIAIQKPADNLVESDFLENPIGFRGERFDLVVAQGVFEYVAAHQDQKMAEIAQLLTDDGVLLASYLNFGHRDTRIYKPYSNIQPTKAFLASLERHFTVEAYLPTSYHWVGREPRHPLLKALQMPITVKLPVVHRHLAVEYFFRSSPRR
jgi:SAM-dependent methyltransferase